MGLEILVTLFKLVGVEDWSIVESIYNQTSHDADKQIEEGLIKHVTGSIERLTNQAKELTEQVDYLTNKVNDLREENQQLARHHGKTPLQALISDLLNSPDEMVGLLGAYRTTKIDEQLQLNQKIDAIRTMRQAFNIGLKDAKEIVEARQAYLDGDNGCSGW